MKYEKVTNEAKKHAGFREKYAIEHAERIEKKTIAGMECYIFHYSAADPYQDANGATYDRTHKTWIN